MDETSLKTNMTKTTGWSRCGERLIDHAPFGYWQTQTFIAALRHDRLDAPWVISGAPLVHVNMHCRAMDQPRILRPLHRNPTGTDPAKGRRGHTRQPCHPSQPEGRSHPERYRRLVPVPAAILPRSQSDRDGIRQDQDPDQKGSSKNIRPAMASRRKRLQHLQGRRMLQLLQSRRISNRLSATRSSRVWWRACCTSSPPIDPSSLTPLSAHVDIRLRAT